MKRFTMILALAVMIAMPLFAERVTPETARKVATTFLNNNGAKTNQLTDLSKAAGFPNLYIFTTEQSFVVMSADDCVKPILGYSLNGSFDSNDMPENLRGWLQGYNEEIQWGIDNRVRASAESAKQWKELSEGNTKAAKVTTVVAPLIRTKWNQNKYYNDLCPTASEGPNGHAYTGCVATAMAQIMKYHSYPSSGIGSHSYTWNGQTLSADFGATTYDWDNMNDYYEYYYNDNGTKIDTFPDPSPTEITAIATLMYHCGVSLNMKYSGSGSGAFLSDVANVLKNYFNYSSTTKYKHKDDYEDTEWKSMVKHELDERRPLEYGGSGSSGGHAFVCDGYNDSDYFHFNWGWAGHYDGYFSLDNLDPKVYEFNSNQAAIFGVQPSQQCLADAPSNLTYTLAGIQDLTLNWTVATGAVSYNIYCNNCLVGNTTETTYTEAAPFGTNVYWVRSVDANGQLSLFSNLVTVTVAYPTPIVDDLEAHLSGNGINLTWSSPSWCYPSTPTATLTYGEGNRDGLWGYHNDTCMYWGHRYPASDLSTYDNMYVYKVSFCASASGSYEVYIYEGTTSNLPQTLVLQQTITVCGNDWFDIDLSNPIQIDASQDLWVFMYDPEGRPYIGATNYNSGSEGNYFSTDLTSYIKIAENRVFLIKTFVSDGTYTYNLYDNGTKINGDTPISDTNYTISNIADNTIHQYTVKTNYYGDESDASNKAYLAKGTTSLETLDLGNDNMTIAPNSKLTVGGTLTNTDPANLILEDGAQLILNSDGVAATVKKNIAAWTIGTPVGGWYFIASPLTGTTSYSGNGNIVNNLITDDFGSEGSTSDHTYDFYRLAYENTEPKWKNYRNAAFDMSNGQGFLYANESAQTLSFKGEIMPYDAENNTVTLAAGWNLIGNPYTRNVVPSLAYHILNNGAATTSVNANAGLVTPGMGIAVYSENGGALSLNLPSENAAAPSNGDLQITLNQQITNRNGISTISIDNTIVSFNESEGLPKFPLLEANSKLYIPKGKEEYAIVSSAAQGEMPINFRASEDGTYTLTVNPEGVEMNYLHLIDNLTGDDVDLLASPYYTFEAKTTDYASRFRLVFASVCEDANDDNESFAFINDGNIIVYKEGILQIVDLMGRVLVSTDVARNVSTSGMTSGVYVLRLIDGENVKTQKIVIE